MPCAMRTHRNRTGYAAMHGLVVPVDVYPLYENAGRAARERETLAEGQAGEWCTVGRDEPCR